jgi:hypothetical protein
LALKYFWIKNYNIISLFYYYKKRVLKKRGGVMMRVRFTPSIFVCCERGVWITWGVMLFSDVRMKSGWSLYILQVHNCPLFACNTLYTKLYPGWACSNYVRFFCWGRFLTCGFCCSQPMGTRVIDMGTNKYVVTCAYLPFLFPCE